MPLPRLFSSLERLHLFNYSFPQDAHKFWLEIFEAAPRLASLKIDFFASDSCGIGHLHAVAEIAAPRLSELCLHAHFAHCAYFRELNIASSTLRSLEIRGFYCRVTVDAPLVSFAVHASPDKVELHPSIHSTLTRQSLTFFEASYFIYELRRAEMEQMGRNLRRFENLKALELDLQGSLDGFFDLIGAMDTVGNDTVEDLVLRSSVISTHPSRGRRTFVKLFRSFPRLKTLTFDFEATPVWITDLVCSVAAPSLKMMHVTSVPITSSASPMWPGEIDATRLRAYLHATPGLHVSTRNITHFTP
jgi:hypothetical protein